jgi:hypothetical protein
MITIPTADQFSEIATRYELPSYVFGLMMLIFILVFHGIMLGRISRIYIHTTHKYLNENHLNATIAMFYLSIVGLVIAHIVEITLWGMGIFHMGLIDNFSNAILFAGSTYTTLGFYGDVLPVGWKMTIIIISFSGMFCFAWTTSIMIDMIKIYRIAQVRTFMLKHPHHVAPADPLDSL